MQTSREWARDLQAFVAVAERLSFTSAAESLYLSQPAVSKQVRGLEARLGTALLARGHRSIALTPAGAALLPHARRVLSAWDDGVAALQAVTAAERTTVTLGFQTRIGRGLVPQLVDRLAVAMPDWRLVFRQVSWDDPSAGLANGGVDVAVAWLPVGTAGLASRVVATEPRWVALPLGHPLAERPEIDFADLDTEGFVALPASAGAMRRFWLAEDERSEPVRVTAEAASADEAFEAVANGLGVVLLSAGNAALYERPDVVCRPVTGLSPSELAVVWRAGDNRQAVQALTEELCQCIEQAAPMQMS